MVRGGAAVFVRHAEETVADADGGGRDIQRSAGGCWPRLRAGRAGRVWSWPWLATLGVGGRWWLAAGAGWLLTGDGRGQGLRAYWIWAMVDRMLVGLGECCARATGTEVWRR